MSAKITRERRRAFLRALAASGNLTLSAERAKVSRSWVCLHRANDPKFDAACVAAIAEAKATLGHHGRRQPSAGWGFADGVELVVSGTNGRRTQVRRAKYRQWTPRVERRFLEALSTTCNVKAACSEAGMSQSSAYVHRARWPAFARHWDDAIVVGYAGLDAGLIQGAIAFMEGGAPEIRESGGLGESGGSGGPIRVTSVGEAIQALTMNRFAVTGIRKKQR